MAIPKAALDIGIAADGDRPALTIAGIDFDREDGCIADGADEFVSEFLLGVPT